MIRAEIRRLAVPIKSLKQHPRNPRKGNVDLIRESLEAHGQYRPVIVQKSTGRVLAGNHTLKAAKALGWDKIAATFIDVDDDQALRILLADNRTSDASEYDDGVLAELLQSLDTYDGTGYEQPDVDKLIQSLAPPEFTPTDDVPRLDQKSKLTQCPECGHEF